MILLGTDIKHVTLPASGVNATVVKTLVVTQLVKTAILMQVSFRKCVGDSVHPEAHL
jgi:hypothetical protein